MLSRFAANEERSIAQVRDCWDAIVSGKPIAADRTRIDPDIAATVQHIHNQDDAPSADSAFAALLLDQLVGDTAPANLPWSAALPERLPGAANASSLCVPPHRKPAWRAGFQRWRNMASAASVVLVLLAIAAWIVTWNDNQEPVPAIIPMSTETTADGVVIRTLFEENVPAGELIGDTSKWVATFKFSLEPGEAWRDRPVPCDLSRQKVVGLVESGTLAMINAGPYQVIRSDGTSESIQAAERADLQAGDSWVYLSDRTETNVQKWNPGSVPMVAYQTDWALDDSCESTPINPEWIWHDSKYGIKFDSSRPVVVTIEQAFVPAGLMVSWADAASIGLTSGESDVFRVIGIESGTLGVGLVPEALMQPMTGQDQPVRQLTLEPGASWSAQTQPNPDEGMEREFRNESDGPLVLTSFAWSYDDAGERGDIADTAGGVTIETLVEQRIQVGVLQETTDNLIANTKYSLEPGERWSDAPSHCESARFFTFGYIESGAMALKTTGSFEVIRADGSSETIPPGSEALLEHGDVWLYSSDGEETFANKWNPGPAPVVSIESGWELDSSCGAGSVNPEWLWTETNYPPDFDAARPIAVSIERATVQPGATLSVDDLVRLGLNRSDQDIFRTVAVASGTLQLTWVPDTFSQAAPAQPFEDFELVLAPGDVWTSEGTLTPPEGIEEEFRNVSAEPLVLEIFSWSYDDVSGQSDSAQNGKNVDSAAIERETLSSVV